MSDTVVERHRIAGPAAHLPAERAVAGYDSASSMLRALGLYLHDCDTPMLGIAPASAEPFIDPLLKALDHLPRGAREALFTWGGIATPAASIGARRSSRRGSRAGSSASTLAITRST